MNLNKIYIIKVFSVKGRNTGKIKNIIFNFIISLECLYYCLGTTKCSDVRRNMRALPTCMCACVHVRNLHWRGV